MGEAFAVVIGVAALLSIPVLVRDLRRGERFGLQGVFTFAVGWLASIALTIGQFTGGVQSYETNTGGEVTLYSDTVRTLFQFGDVAAIIASGLVIAIALIRKSAKINGRAIPFVLAAAVALLSNLATGYEPTVNQFAAVSVLIAAAVLIPGPGAVRGAAYFGATYIITSGVLGLVAPMAAFDECTRKCSIFETIAVGINGSGNAFGLAIALALPFVWIAFTGKTKWWLATLGAVLVVASESRSAQLALVALVVVAFVRGSRGVGFERSVALHALLYGTIAVGIVLPFITDDPQAYSTRGRVWMIAIGQWEISPVFGFGPNAWGSLADVGTIYASDIYSTHNIWLDTLFIGGLIAGALLLVGVISLARAGGDRNGFARIAVLLIPILAAGTLERSISLVSANWLLFVLPALILSAYAVEARSTNSEPEHARSRSSHGTSRSTRLRPAGT